MPICEMSYSFDSTSKFFRQTVTTPVITTKRLSVECFRNWRNHPEDVNLITYSREIESVVSQRVPRLSIICGLKLLLPDVLFKKNARFANWQDTPTRIIVTYSFMLQSLCQIPTSMKQSPLWQYSLRNSTNSLSFRAPKVDTQICCSGQIHSFLT